MRTTDLLKSSAFMMGLSLIVSLITNFSGMFPSDVLVPKVRSNITILFLASMLTVSLSRIPLVDLKPDRSVLRAVILGLVISSLIPIVGYLALRNSAYNDYAIGWVFIAATPFAASVGPLSFVLRGDMEHACKSTIYVYICALLWIPAIIYLLIGEFVDMKDVIITVVEIIGVPLIASRFLTKVSIPKDAMAIALNCIIFLLVWLSVSSTNFKGLGASVFITFAAIAICRTFILGNLVEYVEKKKGIHWSQRVTDILITSYKNKGIAIALCASLLTGALLGKAMVAVTVSIVIEVCWVVFMDAVLFNKNRMERELSSEEILDP